MTRTLHYQRIVRSIILSFFMYPYLCGMDLQPEPTQETTALVPEDELEQPQEKTIRLVHFHGNEQVSTELLQTKNPFLAGEPFKPKKARQLIKTLMALNDFSNVQVYSEEISSAEIDVHVVLTEGKQIESFVIKGNAHLKDKEIEAATQYSAWKTANPDRLAIFAEQIKNIYVSKGYRNVQITSTITELDAHHMRVEVTIDEGKKSLVKRVCFKGNTSIPSKILQELLFTREDWLLGFINKAGMYHPDAIAADRHNIENFYQNSGFLMAHVKDVEIEEDPKSKDLKVTFVIDEGDLFVLRAISVPGNDLYTEEQLLTMIPLRPGELFSRSRIQETTEALRILWGDHGYAFAEVMPSIQPDLVTKTVDLTLYTNLDEKIRINRINVRGNTKTRDYVIRRQIDFNEGELLTTRKLNDTQEKIERLGYFDPKQGVNWRRIRVDEYRTDLDLIIKEGKTGNIFVRMGFGGSDPGRPPKTGAPDSPSLGFNVSGAISDTNLFGRGIQYSLGGSYAANDRTVNASLFNPWLFNRPIGGGLNVYHRRTRYDDFKNTNEPPIETTTGGSGTINFLVPRFGYSNFAFGIGFDRLRYNQIKASLIGVTGANSALVNTFQKVLNRRFDSGDLLWLQSIIEQDRRNHPLFPSRGYHWSLINKVGINPNNKGSLFGNPYGFYKFEGDFHWYTPLINEYDLIFHFHAHLGVAKAFKDHVIPYRELFHVGGPATVRGFNFGQIGPTLFGDSLGSTKAFFVNAELLFPIKQDNSIRGVIFYDGGAGWDTPDATTIAAAAASQFKNNAFSYRHAVGFGIRLTSPTPIRIDWGFKLDRRKKLGERLSEVHFIMSHDF